MDAKIEVTTEMVERAFELLRTEAPRQMENSLRYMAGEAAAESNAKAPGSMRGTVTVHDLSRGDDHLILLVAPRDVQQHGAGTRVAWWTNFGTGAKASKAVDGNHGRPGQPAKRWFKKVSKAKQRKKIMSDLVRTARRAGFVVNGGGQ